MKQSPDGFVPARGFQDSAMALQRCFNDAIDSPEAEQADVEVVVEGNQRRTQPTLRTPVTTYGKRVRYTVLEFEELLDSSSIDSKGWDEIARTIHRNYTLFDGFIVLHGTDSMSYTCSALSFMLENLGKPVILTGSQAPMSELQSDATGNLLGSLIVAGHFAIPEVCLYFNHKLFRGNRTTKIDASNFDAFASPNAPPLATTTSMKTHVAWDLVQRPAQIAPFSIQPLDTTAHVGSLRIFPGITPQMVDTVLHMPGLRGLVLETFGAGNAPNGPDNTMLKVLSDASSRGIVIVNVTQCLTGSVSPVYAVGMHLSRAGVVAGQDLTSEAALTKLMYLFSLPNATQASVSSAMSSSLRGELTEHKPTIFRHPGGDSLSDTLTALTALGYAIAIGDLGRVKDILRSASSPSHAFDNSQASEPFLLNAPDYSGNTALHIASTSPNLSILHHFLLLGASVHIRNRNGRTPLFLAANAGMGESVKLLRGAGAHLSREEWSVAVLHAKSVTGERRKVWELAGVEFEGDDRKNEGNFEAKA